MATSPARVPGRDDARDRLTAALVALAAQGFRPPCSDDDRWTSDDVDTLRRVAVGGCLTCPVRQECRDAGEHATHGVWGGGVRWKGRWLA